MTIRVGVTNSTGKHNDLKIDRNNSAYVTDTGIPPQVSNTALKPFSIFMKDVAGNDDMRVDGSVTSVDYYLPSSSEGDRYIHTLAITIADAGATMNKFGNEPALANGCTLIIQDDKLGNVTIGDSLISNFSFVQLANFNPSFGTGTGSFKASNVEGASEAYVPVLDIEDVFGMRYGLKILKDATKKLILRVNDDTSGIDRFDICCFGYDVIKVGE